MPERSTPMRTIAALVAGLVLAGCGGAAPPDEDKVLEMFKRCQEVGGQWAEQYSHTDKSVGSDDSFYFRCSPSEPSDE